MPLLETDGILIKQIITNLSDKLYIELYSNFGHGTTKDPQGVWQTRLFVRKKAL